MNAGSTPTDEFWKLLLDEIHSRQVLPVIGPEMVTVLSANGEVEPLYRHLSSKLFSQLGLSGAASGKTLNQVVCDYLLGVVKSAPFTTNSEDWSRASKQPRHLRSANSIPDFELFISTTFDPLLVMALQRVRHGFQARRPGTDCELSRATVIDFHYNDPLDLPTGPGTRVYHLLGSDQKQCPRSSACFASSSMPHALKRIRGRITSLKT